MLKTRFKNKTVLLDRLKNFNNSKMQRHALLIIITSHDNFRY